VWFARAGIGDDSASLTLQNKSLPGVLAEGNAGKSGAFLLSG
jgi:hypothetical protein